MAKKKTFRLSNKALMLLSLLLAIVVWYSIKENISFVSELPSVPVSIEVPEKWAVLERSVDTVKVQFRGTREDIRDLGRDQVKVQYAFVGEPGKGEKIIELEPRHVITTTGAEPVYIKPSRVTLRLDREGSRILPVKADLQGSLPEGINVDQVTVDPNQIEVFGPESRLGEIEFLRTDPIELEGKAQSFMSRVSLVSPSRLWDARLEPDAVNVKVDISDAVSVVERRLEDIKVLVLVDEGRIRKLVVEPAVVSAVVSGAPEVMQSLSDKSVSAFVDCSDVERVTGYELGVRLNLPEGVRVERIEPETVKVSIE
ncbi:YbbR-like domain-containing protein [Verrucomicrobiota bacterium]